MKLKARENVKLLLVMMIVFLLSFVEYNNMYFVASLPIVVSLIFMSEKYFLCGYLSIVIVSLFIGYQYSFLLSLFSLLVNILIFISFRKVKTKVINTSTISSFCIGVIHGVSYYLFVDNNLINFLLYPLIFTVLTYLFSLLIINSKSKDELSFSQIEFIFLGVFINFIFLKSNLMLFNIDISLILSLIFSFSLIQIHSTSGIIFLLISMFLYAPFSGILKVVLLLLPSMFLVRFIAQLFKTRVCLFVAVTLLLSAIFNDYSYLVEIFIVSGIYLIIPDNFYIKFGKYIIDPKDYEIRRCSKMYQNLLSKDKKINTLIKVIEEKIQDNPRMKKKYSDKLSEDLRFLMDKAKEEYNPDIKEEILEELDYINIELISLRALKDYQNEIQIIIEARYYSDYQKIINIIKDVTEKNIVMKLCKYNFLMNSIRYEFVSEEGYEFDYFVKQRSVDVKCGDNYLCFKANNKRYFLISDGMGHGDKASEDSKFALYLIKNFIDLGMDSKKAIESCNALIFSKSDTYNTLDLLEYDCTNNDIVLYKNGSGNSYVQYENKVDKLVSENLPLGIIDEINIKQIKIKETVSRIILTSDGINGNLIEILNKNRNENIKDLVDDIFIENQDISDDQTIMAINVIKR